MWAQGLGALWLAWLLCSRWTVANGYVWDQGSTFFQVLQKSCVLAMNLLTYGTIQQAMFFGVNVFTIVTLIRGIFSPCGFLLGELVASTKFFQQCLSLLLWKGLQDYHGIVVTNVGHALPFGSVWKRHEEFFLPRLQHETDKPFKAALHQVERQKGSDLHKSLAINSPVKFA